MNLALTEAVFPVRLRFDRLLTEEELARFCAANDPLRVERDANGELIVMSPTGTEGGGMESEVGIDLAIWARGEGRGRYFGPNTGFTLADGSVRAADAAWLSWDRWNGLSVQERKGYARVCPEFVVEVRSESDGLATLRDKMRMWVANGAESAWLIDPERRVVEVYRADGSCEVHENPITVAGSGCVAGFELVLNRVWS